MSRRAKESDASLAFSTTTIDDVMMMSFFGYFLPLLCVFWIFFCVLVDLFLFLCSKEQYYSSSVSSEAVCFITLFEKILSSSQKKKR